MPSSGRRPSTTGASACSASCRGSSSETWRTSAMPAAIRARTTTSTGWTTARGESTSTRRPPIRHVTAPRRRMTSSALCTPATVSIMALDLGGREQLPLHPGVGAGRQLSNGLSWGAAYTGSTRRSIREAPTPSSAADQNRARNESKSGSRPHNFVVNYNYLVAVASVGRWNNWLGARGPEMAGSSPASARSRAARGGGFSFGYSPAFEDDKTTGGPAGQRVMIVCDPNLPRGERTETRQFKTECIQMPGSYDGGQCVRWVPPRPDRQVLPGQRAR